MDDTVTVDFRLEMRGSPGEVHDYIDSRRFPFGPPKKKSLKLIKPRKRDAVKVVEQVAMFVLQMDNQTLSNIKIKHISRMFDINASFLSRKFKDQMDHTLCDFIQQVKIQRAVMLLQRDLMQRQHTGEAEIWKPLRIDTLSSYLGFSSTEYFIRCFKKRMGVSPNRYRNCMKSQLRQIL